MRVHSLPLSFATSPISFPIPPSEFIPFLSPISSTSYPCLSKSTPKFVPVKSKSPPVDTEMCDDDDEDYDDDYYCFLDEETDSFDGEGVYIEVKKLGRNSRRIRSKIGINASLETIWSVLTDYEKLSDFIPALAVNELVEKKDNFARLYQVGRQHLALGLKFDAKALLDCYEKDLQVLPHGRKREIEFNMVEGDFQCFQGKWSIEQFSGAQYVDADGSVGQEFKTTLSYMVDVKPKMWLPVALVEGRLCREIKVNLSCIRDQAKRVINSLRALR